MPRRITVITILSILLWLVGCDEKTDEDTKLPAPIAAKQDRQEGDRESIANSGVGIDRPVEAAISAIVKGRGDQELSFSFPCQGGISRTSNAAIYTYVQWLRSENAHVRALAAEHLGSYGWQAREALILALEDEDVHVRQAAMAALKQIDPDYHPERILIAPAGE